MDQFFNFKKLLRNRVSILYHESNINDANAKLDPIYNLKQQRAITKTKNIKQ